MPSPPTGPPAPEDQSGRRPGTVTAAAVVGIVMGALTCLLSLLALAAVGALDTDLSAVDVVLGLLGTAVAVAMLVGGVRLLRGGTHLLLLRAAYAVSGPWLLGVVANLAAGNGFVGGGLLSVVAAAVVVGLLGGQQAQRWTATRGRAGWGCRHARRPPQRSLRGPSCTRGARQLRAAVPV